MSVLCCHIPDFLIRLETLRTGRQEEQPLALLGEDGLLWAASPSARGYGVWPGLSPRQASMRCPELLVRSLDSAQAQAEQEHFLHTLGRWELPVEPLGWGAAYMDLHRLATGREQVMPLCGEMGRRLRDALGDSLAPALGWDSGKFTARAAALSTLPGRMRLVDKRDEATFLRPLPITFLPLAPLALQQLGWLGIATLGDFARLPETGVVQRFGPAGRLAWLWAQGKDNRPVSDGVAGSPPLCTVDFDPPESSLPPVQDAFSEQARPLLAKLADRLQAVRHLRVRLGFLGGEEATIDLAFVEPVDAEDRLVAALSCRLVALIWPGPLERMEIELLATGQRTLRQQSLFPDELEEKPLDGLVSRLLGRYGPIFLAGAVTDPRHPIPERRSRFTALPAQ